MFRKSAKRFLALVCAASLLTTCITILPSTFVAEAEDAAVETLPTNFTEVTPRNFGIADFTDNTTATIHQGTVLPIDSANKVVLHAKVKFGSRVQINYLYNAATTGGIRLLANQHMYLYNYLSPSGSRGIYVGGRYENNQFVGGEFKEGAGEYLINYSKISTTNNFDTLECLLSLTTEFVDFDGDGTENDLKLGIWFNETLYNNTYFYMRNCLSTYEPYLDMSVTSVMSPFVTAQAMPEGYQVVTPLTYGVPDTVNAAGVSVCTPDTDLANVSLDDTMFIAKVKFHSGAYNYMDYLLNSQTESGVRLVYAPNTSTSVIQLTHYMALNSVMYQGGTFEGGNYQKKELEPIGRGGSFPLSAKTALVGDSFNGAEFELWVTTDFIDFDGDKEADDLQLGIWFNGVLYDETYFYILDCKDITYKGKVSAQGLTKVCSTMMQPSDLGVAPGEYTSAAGEFYTTDLVTSKIMDGTTFYSGVRFEGEGATLYYGCAKDYLDKAVKITSQANALAVSHTYGEEEVELLKMDVGELGVEVINNTFDLKLTTDVIDADADGIVNDIKLGVRVNDRYSCCYLIDVADMMTAKMRMKCEKSASILLGSFGEKTPEEKEWCLDEEVAYSVEKKAYMTSLSVDGAYYKEKTTLHMPGTYSIVTVQDEKIYMQDVTVYRSFDINADNEMEITDLVRMLKVANETTHDMAIDSLSQAGKKAIGYLDEATWTDACVQTNLKGMREALLESPQTDIAKMEEMDLEKVHNYGFEFLGGTNVMPIGGFYLPTPKSSEEVGFEMPDFITEEYFAMIAECGVNLIPYSEVFYDTHAGYVNRMLDLGEKYGVGITVSDRRLSNANGDLTLEKVQEAVADYREHKAFCGVYGVDEPTTDYYTGPREHISVFAPKMNYLAQLGIWAYGNLLPCYNVDYRENYDRYVREWLDTCDVKMLMWDHYVHDKNVQTIDYFYGLSYGRAIAEEYGIPFWMFIQAGSQWEAADKREDSDGYYPNEGEFLWNVNTSLAYGAKGISYFPLIQPEDFTYAASQPYDFERNGLIGASGNKNRWWHYAKKANKQIAAIDEVLMNSVSKGVIVTSEQAKADNADSSCIIEGTAWRELVGITGDVLVGCFNYQGKSAFYVVNYDMEYAQSITLEFSDKYAMTVIQDAKTIKQKGNILELNMAAGEGVLVVME